MISERANEILALLFFGIFVLTLVAVVTHRFEDPSFNSTGFDTQRNNWLGPVGVFVADILYQSVGRFYYVVPFLFAIAGVRVWRSSKLEFSIPQITAFSAIVVSVTSILSIYDMRGGLVGKLFGSMTVALLAKIGATIFFVIILLIAAIVVFNFSYASLIESLHLAFGNLMIRWDEYRERRAKKKGITAKASTAKRQDDESPIVRDPEPDTEDDEYEGDDEEYLEEADEEVGDDVEEEFEEETESEEEELEEEILEEDEESEEESVEEVDEEDGEAEEEIEEEIEEDEEPVPAAKQPAPKPARSHPDGYSVPSVEYLVPSEPIERPTKEETAGVIKDLQETMASFNVAGEVLEPMYGPVVTTFPFKPGAGVKYSRVTGLEDDLCLALRAESVRIDRIPGKAFVGIEVPNARRETIQLRDIIASQKFQASESLLTLALGKTIDGKEFVADLAKMPHLLIAGATGAGKSVGVNTLVVSILYKARPDEVKFIMVDPKRLELGVYADIPHLATPIITDPKRAASSLRWAVSEMELRYKNLAGWGVRNIDGFNAEVRRRNEAGDFDENGDPYETLPYIVIIIDELADLMMVAGKEVEESITRLAQMARAVGIHLVLATQRPSVDVITGLIKANFPSRISFRVSSKVDSRTIIDSNGAERLLGRGDMLFLPPASSQVIRVHGAYVDEKEIHQIVAHIKSCGGEPEYDHSITKTEEERRSADGGTFERDVLFFRALEILIATDRASTSLLQRHLKIGYSRAAGILDTMEREGLIGAMDRSTKAREILPKARELARDIADGALGDEQG